MPSKHDPADSLTDIIENAERIKQYLAGMDRDAFAVIMRPAARSVLSAVTPLSAGPFCNGSFGLVSRSNLAKAITPRITGRHTVKYALTLPRHPSRDVKVLQSFTTSQTNQTVYINPLLVRWVGTYRGATQIHFSDDVNRVLTVSESVETVERALSNALMAFAPAKHA